MANKNIRVLKVFIDEEATIINDNAKQEEIKAFEEINSIEDGNVRQCGCVVNKFYSIFGDGIIQLYKNSEDDEKTILSETSDTSIKEKIIFDANIPKRKVIIKGEPVAQTILETHEDTTMEERTITITDYNNELTDEFFNTKPFDQIVTKIEEIQRFNDVKKILCKIIKKIEDDQMKETARREKNLNDIWRIIREILYKVVSDSEEEESEFVSYGTFDSSEYLTRTSSSHFEIQTTDLTQSSCGSMFFLDQQATDMNSENYSCADSHVSKSPVDLSFQTKITESPTEKESDGDELNEDLEEEPERRDYYFPFGKKYENGFEGYFEEHKIKEVFHYLCSQLLAHTPINPISFLIKLLDHCLEYRETRLNPPLLFQVKHIESLFDSMDPMEQKSITPEQYKTAMFTLGLTDYNYPIENESHVSKDFFIREATRVMINNLDDIIQDHRTYNEMASSRSSTRNGSTVRPNTRI